MPKLEPGIVVAGYRIESLVGRGGMGVVYRAVQLGLDRAVALKVIAPELLEDDEIRQRFLREARAAAGVDHPNVIPVHEAGEDDGLAYIAMRFVDGSDLRTLVRRGGALDPAAATGMIEQAGAALDAIHRAGFVHRDVKPANLLVDATGHVYVSDFGLAKQVLTESGGTRTGTWVGTLDYVAPEQIRGGRIDARADVYALGGVLYYALTGHVPFERQGDEAKIWAQLSAPPPVPSARRRTLRSEFDAVVARAMAKHAEERYPSAGDFGRAARAAVEGTVPSEPERVVARGAAAPDAGETERGIVAEASTHTRLRTRAGAPPIARLPAALIGGGMVAIAGAAVAVALILRPAHEPSAALPTPVVTPTIRPSPTATATPYDLTVTRGIGKRPNSLAVAGADVWVASALSKWLTRVSIATGKERDRHVKIGFDTRGVVAYRGQIWIAVGSTRELLRINPVSGTIRKRIKLPQEPTRLTVASDGVWVATDWTGGTGRLLRYDGKTGRLVQTVPIYQGVDAMVAAFGTIWVVRRDQGMIARLVPGTSFLENRGLLPATAHSMRPGAGWLWVTYEGGVARLSPDSPGPDLAATGSGPAQLVVADGRLFVASRSEQVVIEFDPTTLRRLRTIPVGVNPYALTAKGDSVWVTAVGDNTLTRIDLH